MTAESKDLITPKRNWDECAIIISFFVTTYYCKIETPTGKVIFGKFDQDPNGRVMDLFIPLLFDSNAKDRNLITLKPSEKLDNLRTSRLAAYNSKQFSNFRNLDATYAELGTKGGLAFFGVSKSCNSVGIPAQDYNLHLSVTIPANRDSFIKVVEQQTNWEVVPATFIELDRLTKK